MSVKGLPPEKIHYRGLGGEENLRSGGCNFPALHEEHYTTLSPF